MLAASTLVGTYACSMPVKKQPFQSTCQHELVLGNNIGLDFIVCCPDNVPAFTFIHSNYNLQTQRFPGNLLSPTFYIAAPPWMNVQAAECAEGLQDWSMRARYMQPWQQQAVTRLMYDMHAHVTICSCNVSSKRPLFQKTVKNTLTRPAHQLFLWAFSLSFGLDACKTPEIFKKCCVNWFIFF